MRHSEELALLIRYFEDYATIMRESSDNALEARDFYDGMQWTEAEVSELSRRGQPVVVDNITGRKVDAFIGLHTSAKSEPKAFPRTPQDETSAEAMTDAMSFVMDAVDFDGNDEAAIENLAIEGTGALECIAQRAPDGEYRIIERRIPWDRWFYDPFSRELDFSDALYRGQAIWYDYELAKQVFGDVDALQGFDGHIEGLNEQFQDRPSQWVSVHQDRKRIRIVEIYYQRGGELRRATFTKNGWVKPPELSPYVDDEGQRRDPYIAQSAYITREGWRYGMVEQMKTLQREVNKRRSKLLHLLSVNRVKFRDGAFSEDMSINDIRREVARPDMVLRLTDIDAIDIESGSAAAQQIAGQAALLQQTIDRLNDYGPNEALTGEGASSASGRAQQVQQQAGALKIAPLLNRARSLRKRRAEALFYCIRQFWRAPKWVRVIKEKDKIGGWVGLNIPQFDAFGNLIGVQNDVSKLHYDFVIEEAPDYVNLQAEQFDKLVSIAPFVQFPPEVYISASGLRNKDELMDLLKGKTDDPEAQQAAQLQQEMQQLDIEERRAKIADEEASAIERMARAQKLREETESVELENVNRLIG